MEKKTEVKVFEIRKFCECGGEFKFTESRTLSYYPPVCTHKCDKCSKRDDFNVIYPKIVYEPVINDYYDKYLDLP